MADEPIPVQASADSASGNNLLIHVLAIAVYAALACTTTWPLASRAQSRLPIGTEETRTVAMFNAWTIWWNADRLGRGGQGYWDAPIFFPEKNTFALSEPQPATMVVAPLIWFSDSRLLAYNVYLLLSLILNGWLTQLLLRYLGVRILVAVGGGMAMVLLPIVHWQIGVVQLVPVWGILWTWLAYTKILLTKADLIPLKEVWWRGGELGLAVACTAFASVHHAIFLSVLMVGAGWTLGRRALQARVLCILAIAIATSAALVSPIVLHLRELTKEPSFTRPDETVAQLSLKLIDYGAVYGHSWLPTGISKQPRYWRASPGWLKLPLAVVGLCVGIFLPAHRSGAWFLTTVIALGVALSLGTNLEFGAWRPWSLLSSYIPGFAQVRSAFRFAYFVQIAVVIAAALGANHLWSWCRAGYNIRRGYTRMAWIAAAALVFVLDAAAVLDPWPAQLKLGVVPDARSHRDWIEILARSDGGGAALCLPMASGDTVLDFEIETEWMMLGTYHGAPLVNGYSGFFPTRNGAWREQALSGHIPDLMLKELYEAGVRFVVVDRRRFKIGWQAEQQIGDVAIKRIVQSSSGVDLYHLGNTSNENAE